MLHAAQGLSPAELRAVADLEQRVVAADGGRLKLEWGTLETRSGRQVDDLLWWQDGQLLGFLGLYAFGGGAVELAGMVAPAARRHGIGTALLDAALPLCRDRGSAEVLLVVPRQSAGGAPLALARGAALDHSEHALVLFGPPEQGAKDPLLTLRPADPTDAPVVARLLEAAFGVPSTGLAERPAAERTLVVELAGAPVGTLRLTRDGADAGIYGFAVDPAVQGRGIGRDVLRRVCRRLQEDGAGRIGLEVAVDNDRALGLYTSVGFRQVSTEDYYRLGPPR